MRNPTSEESAKAHAQYPHATVVSIMPDGGMIAGYGEFIEMPPSTIAVVWIKH